MRGLTAEERRILADEARAGSEFIVSDGDLKTYEALVARGALRHREDDDFDYWAITDDGREALRIARLLEVVA